MHHRFHSRRDDGDFRHHAGPPRRGRPGLPEFHFTLLSFLAEKPRFGYDLVQEAIETPRGAYSLSPSLVYPALTYLEEIGHVTGTAEGARTRYEITDAGRERLRALQADRPGGGRRSLRDSSEWWVARSALKAALRDNQDASAEEQQRIVAILERATAEIRGNPAD